MYSENQWCQEHPVAVLNGGYIVFTLHPIPIQDYRHRLPQKSRVPAVEEILGCSTNVT